MRRWLIGLGILLVGMAVGGLIVMLRQSTPIDVADAHADDFEPVAWLTEPKGQRRGVRDIPLEPGESLGFFWDTPQAIKWTMKNVPYDLLLHGIDDRGRTAETLRMPAGTCCWVMQGTYQVYVEERVKE